MGPALVHEDGHALCQAINTGAQQMEWHEMYATYREMRQDLQVACEHVVEALERTSHGEGYCDSGAEGRFENREEVRQEFWEGA